MLSKSKYVRGMNCNKSLWLYVHKKNEQVVSESTQAIFSRGTQTGELAREYFPGGELAVTGDYPSFDSAKRTLVFINKGIETIYEATFIFENTLVAIDILHKENGKWFIYEVKSTNSVKPEHIKDVAVQYYVAKGSGLIIEDVFIMHFNKEYVRKGKIDVKKLFLPESVLQGVNDFQKEIKNNIPVLLEMLKGEEPVIAIGNQCTHPYPCDFIDYCQALAPNTQEKVHLSNIPEIHKKGITDFLKNIEYPLCHLDFETIMPGVPMFDESRPYQQIPFQFSMHLKEKKSSEWKHFSYLAESDLNTDPRREFVKLLIKYTKKVKTIFVYYQPFEETRIKELIRDFPEYQMDLINIIERLQDLIVPFKSEMYRTETMEGSSSIKKVLPALCPDLSYDILEISNGMAASNSFLELYYKEDKNEIATIRRNLLEYCYLDTWGMVRIFEILEKVAGRK